MACLRPKSSTQKGIRWMRLSHGSSALSATFDDPNLVSVGGLAPVLTLAQDCRDIAGILHTVELIRSASQPVRDLIAGYGELWSTRLFSA